jgi:inorganic pyrophosphatase
MDLTKISIGRNPPYDVNVIVEIPQGSAQVKYELDRASGAFFVDRFLHTAMFYPGNYGFVPHTLAQDGDPVDVLILGAVAVVPGAVVRCRPVGVLYMEDQSGGDEKILAVPIGSVHAFYADIHSHEELPSALRDQIDHFFRHYKDLDREKWVRLSGWGSASEAADVIMRAIGASATGVGPSAL